MSRARPIIINGKKRWFDTSRNSQKATAEQLELLATTERIDLDDLLDEHPTQGEVVDRLRRVLGQNPIPPEVIKRRQKWRKERQRQPVCRKCGKIGDSTKHHFINKWILRELEHYSAKWADRSKSTIPLCIDCHRDFHARDNGPVSIVEYLTDTEREFAQAALDAFTEERPKVAWLIVKGSDSVYEARLLKDYVEGKFQNGSANGRVSSQNGAGRSSRAVAL